MIEIVYAACAWMLLGTTLNVTEYHMYLNEEFEYSDTVNVQEVCAPGYPAQPEEYSYSVTRYYEGDTYPPYEGAGSFVSSISQPLTIQWVPDADFDQDRVVGMADFGLFAGAWASPDSTYDLDGNGVVGMSDFGLFAQRFGECLSPSRIKVVACG